MTRFYIKITIYLTNHICITNSAALCWSEQWENAIIGFDLAQDCLTVTQQK